MNKYEIDISFGGSGDIYYNVEAYNENEAIEKALELAYANLLIGSVVRLDD